MIKNYKKLYLGSIIASIVTLVVTGRVTLLCIFNSFTGYYCPGCGVTRAVISLFRGQLYQAFRYNSIIFIDIPIILFLEIFVKLFGKNNEKIKRVSNIILIILVILTIMYGVLRNIPSFSYLAPTKVG